MLRINRQTDYAVHVILALVKRGDTARLSTEEIRREMLIPTALMLREMAAITFEALARESLGIPMGESAFVL